MKTELDIMAESTAAAGLAAASWMRRWDGRASEVGLLQTDATMDVTVRRGVNLTAVCFTRNAELARNYMPNQANVSVFAGDANPGGRLLMACQLGVGVRGVAYIRSRFGKHPANHRGADSILIEANTPDQLAAKTEPDATSLNNPVARCSANVRAGDDSDFHRRHLVHDNRVQVPIETAPFHGRASIAAAYDMCCGVMTDPTMQVWEMFSELVQGLRAACEMVVGLYGAGYMTGSALGTAPTFEHVVGRETAA